MSSLSLSFLRQLPIVWGFTILMTGILIFFWYVLQPTGIYTVFVFQNATEQMSINSTDTNNIMTLLKLGVNVFIPIVIVGLWIWAILCSIRTWRHGEYEYYE